MTARLFPGFRIHERRVLAERGLMVDRDLILRRLASLDTYLEQLAPYRAIEVGAYVQDWKTQRVVERTLHLAIETCMDVADHIIADRRLRIRRPAPNRLRSLQTRGCCRRIVERR